MKAKSIKGKSIEEILVALEQSMNDGFTPTLAIAFVSIKQDRTAISNLLNAKGIAVFGCTTNGEFIDEETEKGSAAILLLDLNRDYFQVYFDEYPNGNYKEVANGVAQKAKNKFTNPAFLLGLSNPAVDGEDILLGMEEVVGSAINVFGGGAGDDYTFTETAVFTNGKDSENGMVCIAIDEEKVLIKGVATCGWKAVGTEKTVTKSEGNHVYTVDNIPALDITVKYGGLENISSLYNLRKGIWKLII